MLSTVFVALVLLSHLPAHFVSLFKSLEREKCVGFTRDGNETSHSKINWTKRDVKCGNKNKNMENDRRRRQMQRISRLSGWSDGSRLQFGGRAFSTPNACNAHDSYVMEKNGNHKQTTPSMCPVCRSVLISVKSFSNKHFNYSLRENVLQRVCVCRPMLHCTTNGSACTCTKFASCARCRRPRNDPPIHKCDALDGAQKKQRIFSWKLPYLWLVFSFSILYMPYDIDAMLLIVERKISVFDATDSMIYSIHSIRICILRRIITSHLNNVIVSRVRALVRSPASSTFHSNWLREMNNASQWITINVIPNGVIVRQRNMNGRPGANCTARLPINCLLIVLPFCNLRT